MTEKTRTKLENLLNIIRNITFIYIFANVCFFDIHYLTKGVIIFSMLLISAFCPITEYQRKWREKLDTDILHDEHPQKNPAIIILSIIMIVAWPVVTIISLLYCILGSLTSLIDIFRS